MTPICMYKQKISSCFRMLKGAQDCCIIRSYLDTCTSRGIICSRCYARLSWSVRLCLLQASQTQLFNDLVIRRIPSRDDRDTNGMQYSLYNCILIMRG